MRRTLVLAALCSLALATAVRAEEIPVDQLSYPVPRDHQVRIKFPVGDLRVETTNGDHIEFELRANCHRHWERCADRVRNVRVESEDFGGKLRLEIRGYPKMNTGFSLIGVLRVPRDHGLEVHMGVGDLVVEGLQGNLDLNLGVGDARIRTDESAVRDVDVATGIGDADVRTHTGHVRHHGFISSSANWDEGRGKASVNLRVGVGDADVRLD